MQSYISVQHYFSALGHFFYAVILQSLKSRKFSIFARGIHLWLLHWFQCCTHTSIAQNSSVIVQTCTVHVRFFVVRQCPAYNSQPVCALVPPVAGYTFINHPMNPATNFRRVYVITAPRKHRARSARLIYALVYIR